MATAPTTSAAQADAAQLLYERYYANVYRYALSQLKSPQDAEDAAQNTFLRAFAALQKGVRPENEVAWLFKIAHNVCASSKLAWLRRRRVEAPRDLDLLPDQPASPESRRDELTGLQDALADMPPRLREAFLLREWQGLSYAEIAERLDTSRSAVETLIFRARKQLAQSLEQPVRRVREALGVAPLLNYARGLFDAAPAAVKAAGAVAVLAGAGVAVQPFVTQQKHSKLPAPAMSLPIAPAIAQPAAPASPQHRQRAKTTARTSRAATTTARTPSVPLAPGAPPIQAPEPTQVAPAPTPAPAASTPATPSSGKATPSVLVPPVETPPIPSVTTPVLPITTPSLPPVTTPAIPTPPLEIPATVSVPDLPTVPSVTLPSSAP